MSIGMATNALFKAIVAQIHPDPESNHLVSIVRSELLVKFLYQI